MHRHWQRQVNYHVVYVSADTHAIPMVLPRKYSEGNGAFNGTVSINTNDLSNGRHKVITRCDLHVGMRAGSPRLSSASSCSA